MVRRWLWAEQHFQMSQTEADGSLKFEGVLHIVVRSRYERDCDYPQ
jgi:hypothetical protein